MAKKPKAAAAAKSAAPGVAAIVMLRNNWPGNFRRAGLEFKPGVPEGLSDEQLEAVKKDLGNALVEVELDGIGRPRVIDRTPPEVPIEDQSEDAADESDLESAPKAE